MTGAIDLLVIGGGPAGVTAAIQGRQLGAKVTLLEADQVGGTNLNRGPGPVRTIARSARLARDWESWSTFGLEGPPPKPNLAAILSNSDRVARHAFEKKHLADQLRRNGIDLVEHLGPVHFADPHTVAGGDGRSWEAERIVLAVGGHAGRLAIPGNELALTYGDLRGLTSLPAVVAVVGAADTGCQIASILSDFGTRVCLFEAGPTIVPHADPAVSAELERAFERQGIETLTNAVVQSIRPQGDHLLRRIHDHSEPAEMAVGAVFFAVGWPPNVEDLDLDAIGIRTTPMESPWTPIYGPMSTTFSLRATSTADPCWSRWPGLRGASLPKMPSSAQLARSTTTSCRVPVLPIPNMAESA